MNFRQFPSSALVAASLLVVPASAFAWGAEGHEIVAGVALRELTPAARVQVAHLLGGEAMLVAQSNWADEIKSQRRDTAPWHFVDIPLPARGLVMQRDCADGNCVVAQIQADLQVLRNKKLGDAARAQALLFLIHFVADVHQPLHAEDNDDKGGNEVRVESAASVPTCTRCGTWMWSKRWGLIPALPPQVSNAPSVANSVRPGRTARRLTGPMRPMRSPATRSIRRYRARARCGCRANYAWREAQLTRLQLARAGVRLAWLLNTTLK